MQASWGPTFTIIVHEYIYTRKRETRLDFLRGSFHHAILLNACFENLKYSWQLVGESFKNANVPVVECSRVNPHSHLSGEILPVKRASACRVNRP